MKKGIKRLITAGCIVGAVALTIGVLNIIPPKKVLDGNPNSFIIEEGSRPLIAAHRGCKNLNPENTFKAIDYSVEHYDIDIIVTHEPPLKVKNFLNLNDPAEFRVSALNAYFEELSQNCKFNKWYFGSLHLDKYISGTHRAIFKDVVNAITGEKL